MSGLARAVAWTQGIGYAYPADIFQAALKATFPRLTETEVVHCANEHQRVQAEWMQRVEGWVPMGGRPAEASVTL